MFSKQCFDFASKDCYAHVRPVARIFARAVTWVSDVYVCMYNDARLGGSGTGF